jgi:hypothetical protein
MGFASVEVMKTEKYLPTCTQKSVHLPQDMETSLTYTRRNVFLMGNAYFKLHSDNTDPKQTIPL